MHNPTNKCPKCSSVELGKGKMDNYARMSSVDRMNFGSAIEYIICTNCGYIIEGYVKKPEKFKR
ncbi:transcription initiation factor TFIIIB [Ornithinibacillus halotolerans]|uniref:Transcription initiation factor TFIIIB n=1 Tax=Ornithinibacillus halotolerans TaxID=1274357 RepID=A0A916RWP8_9BACI|nr:transcription initiation factor TFIIIB [Ornithinibacillus halotolerans]GGA72809.1 hypothetical protein GCM10008025_15750 [Ornithinibacillus halotolerans]